MQHEPQMRGFWNHPQLGVRKGFMIFFMNDNLLVTVEQLSAFVSASRDMNFVGGTRREKYTWIERPALRAGRPL